MISCYVHLAVTNDSNRTERPPVDTIERSEADKIVDGLDFGELCNEFECISSPSVEATARQLVRDILELREGNRALGTYAVAVKYKVYTLFVFQIFYSVYLFCGSLELLVCLTIILLRTWILRYEKY